MQHKYDLERIEENMLEMTEPPKIRSGQSMQAKWMDHILEMAIHDESREPSNAALTKTANNDNHGQHKILQEIITPNTRRIALPSQQECRGSKPTRAGYLNGAHDTAIRDIYRKPMLITANKADLAIVEYGQCISQELRSRYNAIQLLQSTKAKPQHTAAVSLAQDNDELRYLRCHH